MATSPITPHAAHVNLIRALKALPPPAIAGNADADDIKARVAHLRAIYRALIAYLDVVVADTTDHLPGHVDCAKADGILLDAFNEEPDYDVVAELARAGCRFAPAASLFAAA